MKAEAHSFIKDPEPVLRRAFDDEFETAPDEFDGLDEFLPDTWPEEKRPTAPPSSSQVAPPPMLALDFIDDEITLRSIGMRQVDEHEYQAWLARKRVTGVVSRQVQYLEGQRPGDDILHLYRSRQRRIVVSSLRQDGIACRSGVCPGDQLVSIDGKKDFEYRRVKEILDGLTGPVSLIFIGFCGKLQAEVLISHNRRLQCGVSDRTDICSVAKWLDPHRHAISTSLHDAVVFTINTASILMLTRMQESESDKANDHGYFMYELSKRDANRIVLNVMQRLDELRDDPDITSV